jgi:hypothetical protein
MAAMPIVWPALALSALWAAFAWPWLSGAVTIPWDGKAHFAPQVQFLAASLARGEWPFWAPFVFAGHPQIADPQSMMFSPPMLLLAAVNSAPSLWAIDTTVWLTVLFGGLGVLVYGRIAGWHWAAAMIAALVFMFGAAMAWRVQHFGQVMSLAYLPLTLVCLRLAVREGSVLAGIGAGLLGAAILLGRDQVGLLAIYTLAAYAFVLLAGRMQQPDGRGRTVVALVCGALVGVVVVAMPLWMTLLLAEHSNRPDIEFAGAVAGSLHPALLLTLFSANLFGSAGAMAAFWGPPSFSWNDTGLFLAQNMGVAYVSLLGLAALVYGSLTGAAWRGEARFWTIATVVMLVYALGGYTPVFQWLYALVPGVDKFRRPADALFLVGGFAALVIGRVVTAWFAEVEDSARRGVRTSAFAWIAAVGVIALGLSVALAVAAWREHAGEALFPVAVGAVWLVGLCTVIAVALWLRPIRPLAAGAALVGFVALDLVVNNGPNGATALPTTAIDMLQPEAPHRTVKALKRRLAATRDDTRRDRAELVGLGYHWPNAPLSHSLPVTLGANPVRLRWFAAATGAIDTVANVDQRAFPPSFPGYGSPLGRRLGLKWVVLPADASPIGGLGEVAIARKNIGPHAFYELPDPLPRAVFAARAKVAEPERLMAGSLPDDFADPNVVYLPPEAAPRRSGTSGAATVQIDRMANTEVVIAVDADAPGWLILHDAWHPWWMATVNGAKAPVLRANGIFRAVAVGAGRSRVVFTFKPLRAAATEAAHRLGLIPEQTTRP